MERVQFERPTTERVHRVSDPNLAFPSQGVRLTNGCYSVSLTAVGGGASELGGMAISRWVPDPTCDQDGFFIYLRDLDDGALWSAAYQPTRVAPDSYEFQFSTASAEILRLDREIECRQTLCVAAAADMELRRCRLTNRGNRPRRIELTSYVEFVLSSREADEGHPTFSKLFVETEFRPDENAIIARRRPRGADDAERFGFHRALLDADGSPGDVLFETNRKQFIGRGRTLANPRALAKGVPLLGDQGPVLDPIGSLRTVVSLAPGESREVVFLLGAAIGSAEIANLLNKIPDFDAAQDIFAASEELPSNGNGKAARWIAHASHEGLDARLGAAASGCRYVAACEVVTENDLAARPPREALQFDNSYGGFSADGREYVIRIEPDENGQLRLPPQPWVNVIANEHAGCIVTERGAGYTWAGNSRENRLTTWYNDPVSDPHAEALWIRDEEAEVFWSPLPGPTPADAPYEVRHGFGYTTFRHNSLGLGQEVTVFVAPQDPVKLVRLRIENTGHELRRLTLFAFQRWALGCLTKADAVTTEFNEPARVILARNPSREIYGDCVAFSAVVAREAALAELAHTGDRATFLGKFGDLSAPQALATQDRLDGRTGHGLDACAAWQLPCEIAVGETVEVTILLGEAADREQALELVRKYRAADNVQQAFDESTAFWRDTLSAIEIETPDRAIDLMVNGWLAYQNLACRMWARSAYYQPGGAFGFRDQLQDSSALLHYSPEITRRQILRHASRQFVDGDVMHWWHVDSGFGLRTRFSDDLVWLPYVTSSYVRATGDEAVLEEVTPFIAGEPVPEGHAEIGYRCQPAGASATVYEHCCRALDRALTAGTHGLPLIGCGDWNDGMNRVGQHGQGESVWLGFFLYQVLGQMLPICARRDDQPRLQNYAAQRDRLAKVLNDIGWDGGWYRRAFYDNGKVIGSAASDECQIDALAQAWAVLSGVATRERAALAIAAVEERLVDDEAGLIRLLTPAFDKTPNDPGYIKGYVPGVRENGGQYTHGVLWFIAATAEMGRGTRAVELLRMLSPVSHSATAAQAAVYQTEPYVVAADVYAEPPHVGRGGWTWYTGSAGWMLRVALESILGLSLEEGKTLVLRPAISASWPSCRINYRLPDGRTRYEITIENPSGKETGVTVATLDDAPAIVEAGTARIALQCDGKSHRVVVRL